MSAEKHDSEKESRPELLDAAALWEVGRVLKFGADKYAAENWREGLKYQRVVGAALRHIQQWQMGENLDDETDISHLAHAMCCLMFLLSYELYGRVELDDRPSVTR